MRWIIVARGALGVAVAQLRHRPTRTLLVLFGIALAVLATTLLASTGIGVMETGDQQFDRSERDLWVTAGPMQLTPQEATALENPLHDAHAVADEIGQHEDVETAAPIAVEAVYVGTDQDNLTLVTGVGVRNTHGEVSIEEGRDFEGQDPHYANGSYDGPMTGEAIIDPRTADRLDVSVGDTIHVGGSETAAREHEFTVIGLSADYGQFLQSPTIMIRLSELQTVVGTAGNDRATMIAVKLGPGADVEAAQADLEREFPEYEIRTNREQLATMLSEYAFILASGISLVMLAVLAGLALTINVLALLVYQQRRVLAALRAIGLSRWTLASCIGLQGLFLGLVGGGLGLVMTPVAVGVLNQLVAIVTGFDSLLHTPPIVYVAGVAIALGIGAASAIVSGLLVIRSPSLPGAHH